jgi:glycosyltransferase involved in cell wall biosynthesis
MIIAIDIRAMSGVGGVGEYTRNIVRSLILSERVHTYVLFMNSWHDCNDCLGLPPEGPHHIIVRYHYPNKLFHAAQWLLKRPYLDLYIAKAIGKKPDLFFFPNIHFASVSQMTPVVVTLHDISFLLHPELLSRKSYVWHSMIRPRAFIAHARHIIAVSRRTKGDCVIFCKRNARDITVAHIDCDPEFHQSVVRPGISEQKKNIVLFNAHEARKNAESAFEAFTIFLKRHPTKNRPCLVLVGQPNPLLRTIARRARRLNIDEYVSMLDTRTRAQRHELYASARALLYPSMYEGFGLPLIEAALSGVPIISSNRGSVGEVIGNGALLVDPYNVNEIVRALEYVLIEDDVDGGMFAEHAEQNAQRYSWRETADMTRSVFEHIGREEGVCA